MHNGCRSTGGRGESRCRHPAMSPRPVVLMVWDQVRFLVDGREVFNLESEALMVATADE